MKFLNIFLLTMGLVLGAAQGLAGTVPGGSGSPSDFPDGVTVTTIVASGAVDLGSGVSKLNVDDTGTSTCTSGGNVCSGKQTMTCVNLVQTDACSGTIFWQRVGNMVTGSIKGSLDAASTSLIVQFEAQAVPETTTNFTSTTLGGGSCSFLSATPGVANSPGILTSQNGTQNLLMQWNGVSHLVANTFSCSFSYEIL